MLISYYRISSYQTGSGMQVPMKKTWQEEVYKSLALFSHHICQEFPSANLPRYNRSGWPKRGKKARTPATLVNIMSHFYICLGSDGDKETAGIGLEDD